MEDRVDGAMSIYPPSGGAGTAMDIRLDANASLFTFQGTQADFGEGITVTSVSVNDGWNLVRRS